MGPKRPEEEQMKAKIGPHRDRVYELTFKGPGTAA